MCKIKLTVLKNLRFRVQTNFSSDTGAAAAGAAAGAAAAAATIYATAIVATTVKTVVKTRAAEEAASVLITFHLVSMLLIFRVHFALKPLQYFDAQTSG